MEQSSHRVKSADRVLDILELFTGGTETYNLTEISKNLNMPASSTYLLLQNMLNRGYLEADKSGKQFRIGYKLFMIRSRYIQGTSLSSEFYQIADRIIEDLNETISLSIRSGNQLHYIGERVSTQALRYTSTQGGIYPLHATASGKVLLANLSFDELREIYPEEELVQITDKTIRTFTDLLIELEEIKKTGVGYNNGETITGVHCIAGGVFDGKDHVVASLSISIPDVRNSEKMKVKALQWLHQASEELSHKVFR